MKQDSKLKFSTYHREETIHAVPMKRGDFFRRTNIQLDPSARPSERGYLVIFGKDTPAENQTWVAESKFNGQGFKLVA